MSPISEARRRANERYNAKAYEEIKVRVSRGEKAVIQAHAEACGESVNGFINRAITEALERDNDVSEASEGRAESKEEAGD